MMVLVLVVGTDENLGKEGGICLVQQHNEWNVKC